MTAITVSDYSRTAPRGAVIAAEVFVWVLEGLRSAWVRIARRPVPAAANRAISGAFPA